MRTYLALHYARGKDWARAVPLLEQVVADSARPGAGARGAGGAARTAGAHRGRDRAAAEHLRAARPRRARSSSQLGQLAMSAQADARSPSRRSRRRARRRARAFRHDLELGVLYLAARRFEDARDALDRVPASHPDYPMALFKRAQVSVLLHEPDRRRASSARAQADATTSAHRARALLDRRETSGLASATLDVRTASRAATCESRRGSKKLCGCPNAELWTRGSML